MHVINISEVQNHCNLGLTISKDLSWKTHVTNLINRANCRLNVLSKYRFVLPRLALSRLYIAMVRPILEYADVIYDNMPLYLSQSIEKTQRRAALICTGAYRHTETQTLLRDLGWQPLRDRRTNHKLILLYKITKGIYPKYLQDLLPKQQQTHYALRHQPHIPVFKTRLKSMANSFFPSAVRAWNKLPKTTIQSESINILKHKLEPAKPKTLQYHTQCTGPIGIWLTRLRLGLSALKAHRNMYNLTEDPNCDHCGQRETTQHFLFHCHYYAFIRNIMYNKFADININTTNTTQLNNTILFGTQDKTLNTTILNIVFEYLKDSNRFV